MPKVAQVESAPVLKPTEDRHVPILIDKARGTEGDDWEVALELGMGCTQGEQLLDGGRTQAQLLHLSQDFIGRGLAVEVQQDDIDLLCDFIGP